MHWRPSKTVLEGHLGVEPVAHCDPSQVEPSGHWAGPSTMQLLPSHDPCVQCGVSLLRHVPLPITVPTGHSTSCVATNWPSIKLKLSSHVGFPRMTQVLPSAAKPGGQGIGSRKTQRWVSKENPGGHPGSLVPGLLQRPFSRTVPSGHFPLDGVK
jgi:hypothetical protein